MLSNITWTEFFAGTLLLAAIYYLYVMIRFYPGEIKSFLNRRKVQDNHTTFMAPEPVVENPAEAKIAIESADSDLDDVEELVAQVVSTIAESATRKLDDTELKWAIELVLGSKPMLKESPYRSSINALIVSECAKNGTVTLSEKEVDMLWK